MTKIIALDIDGVLADLVGGMLAKWGEPLRRDVYKTTELYGLPEEEIQAVFADADFMSTLLPLPGAVKAVKDLGYLGYSIDYLTCRWPSIAQATKIWLWDQGFIEGFVFHMLDGLEKTWVAATCDYEFLVEDHPETAARVAESKLAFIVQNAEWPYAMSGYGKAIPVPSLAAVVEWLKENEEEKEDD